MRSRFLITCICTSQRQLGTTFSMKSGCRASSSAALVRVAISAKNTAVLKDRVLELFSF
jgi:hypothetical protein